MTEEIYQLAMGLGRPLEGEEELLRLLCRSAEQSLDRRLGGKREECPEAFLCAAALLAAAGLLDSRAGGDTERFTVGEVSVTAGGGGGGGLRLRQQAERMIAPYCAQNGFVFRGVRG